MDLTLTRAYIKALEQILSEQGTFKLEAASLRYELGDPDVNIEERLSWIDKNPSTPFEKYLKLRVRRTNECSA